MKLSIWTKRACDLVKKGQNMIANRSLMIANDSYYAISISKGTIYSCNLKSETDYACNLSIGTKYANN